MHCPQLISPLAKEYVFMKQECPGKQQKNELAGLSIKVTVKITRSLVRNCWYQWKGLITKNAPFKYNV